MELHSFLLVPFPSGKRPTIPDLIAITKPDGGILHIMDKISLHPMEKCVQFAHVLLNERRVVEKLENDNPKEEMFIKAVLAKWVSSVEGPATPCTWQNLIDSMTKAGMDGLSIQEIREVVIPL